MPPLSRASETAACNGYANRSGPGPSLALAPLLNLPPLPPQGVAFGMLASYIPSGVVPGLGRVNGTAWSLTDLLLGGWVGRSVMGCHLGGQPHRPAGRWQSKMDQPGKRLCSCRLLPFAGSFIALAV